MKKFLLSCLGLALCAGLTAQTVKHIEGLSLQEIQVQEESAWQAATNDGYDLKFSGNLTSFFSLSSADGISYRNSMYITPEIATSLAGNQVTQITFACGFTGNGSSRPGSVFVAEGRYEDPITSTDCTVVNNYNSSTEYNIVALNEPYTIKEGVGFYVGYTVDNAGSGVYPIGYGSGRVNPFAGYSDLYYNGQMVGSFDLADFGVNLYLSVKTVGDKKELIDFACIVGFNASFTLPTPAPDSDLTYNLIIFNYGSNQLTNVEYAYTNGDDVLLDGAYTGKISGGGNRTAKLTISAKENLNKIKVHLTKIGDKVVDDEYFMCYYMGIPTEGSYPRKFVVEEGTGTWCGYCPRGIVGMDYMEEKYAEDFVGIAVHAGDKFEVESYAPIINTFFSGYPTSIINRDPLYEEDPSSSTLEKTYKTWQSQTSNVKIEMTADVKNDNTGVLVNTNTTFLLDQDKANYQLAFVVLEDGLKGAQSNYYANNSMGTMGGWESKGSSVTWTYTNTARDIFDAFGIENSVPTKVSAGVPVQFAYTVPMTNVSNINNTKIVALVLEGYTGVVLNAAVVEAADYGTTGISSAVAENVCNVRGLKGEIAIDGEYTNARAYNLAGQQVALNGLAAGIYVVNVDGKSFKVAVK